MTTSAASGAPVEILDYGDSGLLVNVRSQSYDERWSTAQTPASSLRADRPRGLVDVVASYETVFVSFDPLLTEHSAVRAALTDYSASASTRGAGRGDTLRIDTAFESLDHPYSRVPLFRLGATRPRLRTSLVVDVTAGPDIDQFEGGLSGPDADHHEVSAHSDHIGLRLLGSAPRRTVDAEILSKGRHRNRRNPTTADQPPIERDSTA